MANIGVNIARDGSIDPSGIKALNNTWVRIVLMPDVDQTLYFQRLRSLGLRILGVLARESLGGDLNLLDYARLYSPYLSAVQAGNEPDQEGESSWTMSKAEFASFGKSVRNAFPVSIPVVSGGLASGQPDWLDDLDLSWAQALGVHAYLKDAPNPGDLEDLTDITTLLDGYASKTTLPIIVSEWGWWGDANDVRATEEVRDMIRWAAGTSKILVLFYFCYTDAMVPPFGLYTKSGKLKPRAQFYAQDAALAVNTDWQAKPYIPPPSPPTPDPVPVPTLDPWQFLTAEQISSVTQSPLSNVQLSWPHIIAQLELVKLNTLPLQIVIAGTVAIETAHRFLPINEFKDFTRYPNSGGYPPHYDGGPNYHGRGYLQNTHLYNYRALGPAIAQLWGAGLDDPTFDLVTHPDNLLDVDMSSAALAIYCRDHRFADGYGIPEAARDRDYTTARKLVQGGSAGLSDLITYCNGLWAVANTAPVTPSDPPTDSTDQTARIQELEQAVEGYKIALRTVVRELMPKLAESATVRDATLTEANRILVQFGADE